MNISTKVIYKTGTKSIYRPIVDSRSADCHFSWQYYCTILSTDEEDRKPCMDALFVPRLDNRFQVGLNHRSQTAPPRLLFTLVDFFDWIF